MTENISYIPTRIKNAAKGGHVTGTEDIIDDKLQLTLAKINAIIFSEAVAVKLTVTPNLIFVGEEKSINLKATSSTSANSILIKKGDLEIISGSGTILNGSDTITISDADNIQYNADFMVGGLLKSASANVQAVNKIYYGSGLEYTDATNSPSPKISPAGIYSVTVNLNENYIFFNVPNSMNINKATLNGFDFPLEAPVELTIDNVIYKVYRSSNTNDAGTYSIIIS